MKARWRFGAVTRETVAAHEVGHSGERYVWAFDDFVVDDVLDWINAYPNFVFSYLPNEFPVADVPGNLDGYAIPTGVFDDDSSEWGLSANER